MPQFKNSDRRRIVYPFVVAGGLLLLLIIYWVQLIDSHNQMRNQVRENALRLASQSAHVLALQVNTLFGNIDYFSQQLAASWMDENLTGFDRSVEVAFDSLPLGSLQQVAVTDPQGNVAYSRLLSGPVSLNPEKSVSIEDREHFKVHVEAGKSSLFISAPVLGRISKQWTIQFSRGMWQEGAFKGVLVVSISTEYLSKALQEAFPDEGDVAVVVRDDGAYLARSRQLSGVMGASLPSTRPFVQNPELMSGDYEGIATVDQITRLYSWWRGTDYPFIVSVGYGIETSFSTANEAIKNSTIQNIISSVLLVLAGGVVLYLWIHRSNQTRALLEAQQRLELALQGGKLGTWDWQVKSDDLKVDATWAKIFGFDSPSEVRSSADHIERIHPLDRSLFQAQLDACLDGAGEPYHIEYRVVQADGSLRWVADRGKVVEWDADGSPLRMSGTQQDVTKRKSAEQKVLDVRDQLSKLVAEVPGAVYQFKRDTNGHYTFPYASPGIEGICGVLPEEVTTSAEKAFSAISPLDALRITEGIEKSARDLTIWRSEFRVMDPDGTIRWISGHSKPERLEDGSTIWHGYLQDVTQEHQFAETLQANEAHLRITLQAIRDGLWSFDHEEQTFTWDARIQEILGYRGEEWEKPSLERLTELIHPLDRKLFSQENLSSKHSNEGLWLEFRLKTAQAEWLWVQVRGRIVEWRDDGLPKKTVGMLSDISRRVAETKLRHALLNRSPAAIVLIDKNRQVIEANEQARKLFLPHGELLPDFKLETVHVDESHFNEFAGFYKQIKNEGSLRLDFPLRVLDGGIRWFDMHGVFMDTNEFESPIVWTMIDISARRAAEMALNTERLRLTVLLKRFPSGVLIEDSQQNIVFVNDRWCDLMQVSVDARSLVGVSRQGLVDLIGVDRAQWHQETLQIARDGNSRLLEIQDEDGRYLEMEQLDIKQNQDYLGAVWLVWDVTDRKQHENQLNQWASTDPLTSMENRRSFLQAFDRYLSHVEDRERSERGVILMADIDHFKKVNDTYGHAVGDQVLKQLAATIKHQVREHDHAGRLGGEEFAVLLAGIDKTQGFRIAERLRQAVEKTSIDANGIVIQITISIGLAVINADNNSDELLHKADEALYHAKQTGRNKVCIWGESH